MKIVKSIEELSEALQGAVNVGLVPTMGALHDGHISLVRSARAANDVVVVSIFVNPTQFNDPKDLECYPRTLVADAELLEAAGADLLFAPTVEQIYPVTRSFRITDSRLLSLTKVMEGAYRPGHFDGVVQVVGRLFDIVDPDRAYFGQKDFQQVAIIEMMVEIEKRRVQIEVCPIKRSDDGLALSSRNALLDDAHRAAAPHIYQVLKEVRQTIDNGATNYEQLAEKAVLDINKNPYLCAQYVNIVDSRTLSTPNGQSVRICAAVQCGAVRLIDNV